MKSLSNTQTTSFPSFFFDSLKAALKWFASHLPLLAVIAIALTVSLQNIHPNKTYTGWDNVHGEFDLIDYSKQVLGGAWSEHQGLGAPSAQGQLSEVPRLPWLWLLSTVLPTNMVRYAYIFITYTIGGITMYLYLKRIWFKHQPKWFASQLAAMGGILYLLHMLTLQQFYISFEMFMAQFAFLPLLLLVLHRFEKKLNIKTVLLFFAVQFLIAPSAHTPTVFYLGVLVSQLYGFFITLKQGWSKAIWTAFLIGLLSFIASAYFIIPNLYYSIENAHYVAESRDNQLFATESLASVREAGTISNFLRSTHYLFTWKDYSFANKEFTFIFNEWHLHLNSLGVQVVLNLIGICTILGAITAAFNKKLGVKRWAILTVFGICILFIWMGMFPLQNFFDWLYQSSIFRETFRNPFTKLSIIYSVVAVIMFVSFWEWVLGTLAKLKPAWLVGGFTAIMISICSGLIIYSALPAFQSHFLSEKLQVEYPSQYQEMFEFLKTKDDYDRILALPQTSHAGWEYYDWQFLGENNGYQGLGFYFFGVDQPVLHRDSDRWVETSDYFYHELKYALDLKDTNHFKLLLTKYQVDLVIIDDTKVEPTFNRSTKQDHQFISDVGLEKIWQKDFLTIYKKIDPTKENIYAPKTISMISAETDRTRQDYAFQKLGDYILTGNNQATIQFPFSNLMTKEINNVSFNENETTITRPLPDGEYDLTLPSLVQETYKTPAAIEYNNQKVTITFPKNTLQAGSKSISFPKLDDTSFDVKGNPKQILVFFNNVGYIVTSQETIIPIVSLEPGSNVTIEYAVQPSSSLISSKQINTDNLEYIFVSEQTPNWQELAKPLSLKNVQINEISFISTFPHSTLNLTKNPSLNCSQPKRGTVATTKENRKIVYQADKYGVNCNGFSFDYPITDYGYIMKTTGTSDQGRGTKVFINFDDTSIVSEDFLFQEPNFERYIGLPQLSNNDSPSRATLNWETRSFGNKSENSLNEITFSALPLNQLAQLQLIKSDLQEIKQTNTLTVNTYTEFLNAFFLLDVSCEQDTHCYFAMDQSHDKLWLSFDISNKKLLDHYRLNNWANVWEVEHSGKILIAYIPGLVASASLVSILILTLILILFSIPQSPRKLR